MVKFVPLFLLAGMVTAVIMAAPKPHKEGLVSHEGHGVWYATLQDGKTARLHARMTLSYAVAGGAGETYTVELWIRPGGYTWWDLYHFDTQDVTIPGEKGGKLTEVKGKFDRRYRDRDYAENQVGPGNVPLPDAKNHGWDCRLIVKKKGKVVDDSGVFKVNVSIGV